MTSHKISLNPDYLTHEKHLSKITNLEEMRFCQKNKKSVQKSVQKNQAGQGRVGWAGIDSILNYLPCINVGISI
jgi:hypothetical protein